MTTQFAQRVLSNIDERYHGGVCTISGETPHPDASLRHKWLPHSHPQRVERYWGQRFGALVLAGIQGAAVSGNDVEDGDHIGDIVVEIMNSGTRAKLMEGGVDRDHRWLVDDQITDGDVYMVSAGAVELFAHPTLIPPEEEPSPKPELEYTGWHIAFRVLGTRWVGPEHPTNPDYANKSHWQNTRGVSRIIRVENAGEA